MLRFSIKIQSGYISVSSQEIARALIGNPEILFADEPTGNLDKSTGAKIMSLLWHISKERGQTIITVTHFPEAAKSSNRVITVSDGLLE